MPILSFKSLACLSLCLLPTLCLAQRPSDFEAHLDVSRNGKPIGELTLKLTTQGKHWTVENTTRGTHGLARFLGLRESSTGEGTWEDSGPRPLHYVRDVRIIKKLHWSADFDWDAGLVHTKYPKGESTLQLQPGTLDETALGLMIRSGLPLGENEWFVALVDEDEIEHAHFRTRSVENISTALGCMKVHVVEKVRGEGNTRYTRTYYAENLDFVPVMIEHGKTDGNRMEGRVTSLRVNDREIPAGPACES